MNGREAWQCAKALRREGIQAQPIERGVGQWFIAVAGDESTYRGRLHSVGYVFDYLRTPAGLAALASQGDQTEAERE